MNDTKPGCNHRAPVAGHGSADDIWLAATWQFIGSHLPAPPATVVELGCGQAGGHIPALTRLGYHATGVDPEAPQGPAYQRTTFEDYQPGSPVDAVVASVSLHHANNLGAVLDHAREIMSVGGAMLVIEWISEDFDETTARWCFRHRLRDPAEPGAWIAELNAEWVASQLPWEAFRQSWLDHHHLHPAAAIRKELADRFVTTHQSTGPYYFPDLLGADALTEHAAIGTGEIRPGCLRYAGRKPPVVTHRLAAGAGKILERYEVTPIGWVASPLTDPAQAPRQGEGAPPAWLVLSDRVAEAIRDLRVGERIIVLTWLDRARRDELTTIPGDNPHSPPLGVFSTRSPSRPNPVGLHRAEILAIDGLRILVSELEALDRTPIVDIKPVLDPTSEQ
jgi:tRNA-Thr(GGU) m(6)t(6)A37 methyltransferase TsaA